MALLCLDDLSPFEPSGREHEDRRAQLQAQHAQRQTLFVFLQRVAAARPEEKKEMLGERLFRLVQQRQPELAGKITGMLLELDVTVLIRLLESDQALEESIKEALYELNCDSDESDEESDEEEVDADTEVESVVHIEDI